MHGQTHPKKVFGGWIPWRLSISATLDYRRRLDTAFGGSASGSMPKASTGGLGRCRFHGGPPSMHGEVDATSTGSLQPTTDGNRGYHHSAPTVSSIGESGRPRSASRSRLVVVTYVSSC